MSLSKSLLTTALIFVVVWGMLIWKNAPLISSQNADTKQLTATNTTVTNASDSATTSVTLVGIKKKVSMGSMSEINQHWQDFYGLNELHGAIPDNTSNRVYGYYRALNDDFNDAELTVGYNSQSLPLDKFAVLETLNFKQFEPLMENSKSWDTTPAWNAIDSNKIVIAVLEEYMMGSGGSVTSTNVYVLYK